MGSKILTIFAVYKKFIVKRAIGTALQILNLALNIKGGGLEMQDQEKNLKFKISQNLREIESNSLLPYLLSSVVNIMRVFDPDFSLTVFT